MSSIHIKEKTAEYQLAPSGTWKRLGQEISILLKDMYATVASRLGGSQARRIFGNINAKDMPKCEKVICSQSQPH